MSAGDATRSRGLITFGIMGIALLVVGFSQSWSVSLSIIQLCLISAIMALGVNIQWGYAGLFNVGIMGFAALGGIAGVLVSKAPVPEAWQAGGTGIFPALGVVIATIVVAVFAHRRLPRGPARIIGMALIVGVGYFAARAFFDPAVDAIESVDPAKTGYLGGLGMPIIFSWAVGGVFAAGAAFIVGRIALGLRSDYLAIATLGISEIIIAMLKNEDWLTRGVKNVTGLARPVPREIDLQETTWFRDLVESLNGSVLDGLDAAARADMLQQLVIDGAGIFVKLCYVVLFTLVLIGVLWLSERALKSPWGRMMRAIRDNETAANAMGKDVTRRHLQVFILGSAVVGVAGAMLTTLDGQFTPGTYNPLRFTFLIWVMVIVGGSGNNYGAVLGGFLIWFVWIEAEPAGLWLMQTVTSGLAEDNALRLHLLDSAAHMRLFTMGLILLLVMRFSPRGLLPEVVRR
ncbi:MAG: branched-chain amino acid ABC transporter permease [Minwuia sp.]|nr:branched-chain amino acid ABC transporter permease [Minwuia sp.]